MATDLDSLWNFDDPTASEQRFRVALASATDTNTALEIQTQIARALGLQRKFDDAHKTLDGVEHARPVTPLVEVRYLLERGRVFNSSGAPDKARPLFLEAWETAREARLDGLAVDAAHMIAIVEPPTNALAWNEKAIAFAEQSSDPKAKNWLGSLYNNLGWTYYDKHEFARALDCFERDLKWFAARNRDKEARIARYSIGKTYRAMGRFEEALKVQQELVTTMPDDGHVHEEIAECFLALGRADDAKPSFARAFELLSKDPWLVANEPQRLERLKRLAQDRPWDERK